MIDNILTNYNKKFVSEQIDHETISKSKLFYKIYNNKISEPLHKFWFSVPNVKYSNNYSDYKTVRFFMNNKTEYISNLINFIKDIGGCLEKKINPYFPNITVDYPWKESTQYPFTFSFFTNNSTLLLDQDNNSVSLSSLSNENTYSIVFEINNIRILPIKLDDSETYSLKINLSLILIKTDKKKDINYYISNFLNNQQIYLNGIDEIDEGNESVSMTSKNFINSKQNKPAFLEDLTIGKNMLNKKDNYQNSSINLNKNQNSIGRLSSLIINPTQLLEVKNTLKKVNISNLIKEDDSDDNDSHLKIAYLEQKNNLKKVNTNEKCLLKHLKTCDEDIDNKKDKKEKKDKKYKKDKNKEKKIKEKELEKKFEKELEEELEKEFQTQIKK